MDRGKPLSLRVRAQAELFRRARERAKQFENPDPVDWIARNFYIPEANAGQGGTIDLMPYQIACLKEALRRGPDGKYIYSVVVWSDIKKSAKSTIAAAVALWKAWQVTWGYVRVVANDLKQADSRVAFYLRRAVELNPRMKPLAKVTPSGYTVDLPNRTRIEAVPIDPGGEAGGGDDMVVFSELWAAKDKGIQRMWTEMTLSPLKTGHSQRWVETYAGFSGESVLLEQLYETGVKKGENIGGELGFPDLAVFRNPTAGMFVLWNGVPRCPWQTPEYYAAEEAVLIPTEFRRIHRNEWASATEEFVPAEWWDNCRGPIPDLERDVPMILVADASVSGDCFGLMLISGRRDLANYEPEEDEEESAVYDVRYAKAWTPPAGQKINYQGTPEEPGPELEIRRILNEYNVVEFVYDPYQLEDMAGRLSNERLTRIYAFGQGAPRLIADKGLYDIIRTRRIFHSGEPDLAEHVKNANQKIDPEDRRLRIIKRAEHLKIDLCVCASMGVARASYWRL